MTRQTEIRFPKNDKLKTITRGIISDSMTLTEILTSDGDIKFGECNSNKFEIELAIDFDIKGEMIQVVIVETDNGVSTEHIMFTGTVFECELDVGGYKRNVVAYDNWDTMKTIDLYPWYNEFFQNQTSMHTVKEICESMFAYYDIPYTHQALVNDDFVYKKSVSTPTFILGDMVKAIGQLTGTIGNVSRDGGFEFIQLGHKTRAVAIDIKSNVKYGETHSEVPVPIINCVAYYEDDETIAFTGQSLSGNIYKLGDNLLLSNSDESTIGIVLQKLLDENIGLIEYYGSDFELIVSDLNLFVGDYVEIVDGVNTYIKEYTFKGTSLLNGEISCGYSKDVGEDIDKANNKIVSSQNKDASTFAVYKYVNPSTLTLTNIPVTLADVNLNVKSSSISLVHFSTQIDVVGDKDIDIEFNYILNDLIQDTFDYQHTLKKGSNIISFTLGIEVAQAGVAKIGISCKRLSSVGEANVNSNKSRINVIGNGLATTSIKVPVITISEVIVVSRPSFSVADNIELKTQEPSRSVLAEIITLTRPIIRVDEVFKTEDVYLSTDAYYDNHHNIAPKDETQIVIEDDRVRGRVEFIYTSEELNTNTSILTINKDDFASITAIERI